MPKELFIMKLTQAPKNSKYASISFIIYIVIFSFLGLFLNIQIKNNLEGNVIKIISKDAQIISKEIELYLCRYGELTAQMLTNDEIVSFVKENDSREAISSHPDYEKVKATLERIKATSNSTDLVWLGMKNINCLTTNNGIWIPDYEYSMQSRSWYIEMTESKGKVTYTQPYIDGITGKMTLSIVAPIYTNDSIVGNVGIDIHMEEINSYIGSYSVGLKGYPVLISNKGIIIYHPDIDSEALMTIEEFGGEISRISKTFSPEASGIEEYFENNNEYYLAYNPIKSSGWYIAAIIPKAETRTQINLINILTAIIFGASTIILIIIALMLRLNTSFDRLNLLYNKLNVQDEELKQTNREMYAAYEQLAASEKQLKAQYDEIQAYAKNTESLKRKYDIAIKSTNSGVWEYEIDSENLYLSENFKTVFGVTQEMEEDFNALLNGLLSEDEQVKFRNELTSFISGEKDEVYCQLNIKHKSNNLQYILVRGRGIYDENKNLKLISGVILDITKIREQERYIEYIAYHDPLTNLPNRIKFIAALEKEIDANNPGAIMLLDLDDFKKINDTLGHAAGDIVLQKITYKLLSIEDDNLLVSRFGGDEFLILFKHKQNINEIEDCAKKIIEVFEEAITIGKDDIHMSCSIGITLYPSDSNDVNQLIANADIAMYRAKDLAKSSYVFFNTQMTDKLKETIKIEKLLREALRKDGFTLLYQPQVSTIVGNIIGFEALLRLKNHQISPLFFIPVAEKAGLIIEIGRWVTKEAIRQLKTWKGKGVDLKPISINFSAEQLHDLGYIEFLKESLREENIPAKYLSIEITEGIFLDRKDMTIRFLNELKDLGIGISLDDFGAGYSSLSYLTFLPVDRIKLDKTLNDRFLVMDNIKVMSSIISLAHSLNLEVTAEGIETIEQYRRLKEVGCDCIQGYLFSKPLEIQSIDKIYNDNLVQKLQVTI